MKKIREVNADIWILTETHEVIDLSETHHGVTTTPSLRKPRSGESCAAIWSRWPIRRHIDTADSSEAVCVEVEHPSMPLLVYGSISAWDGYKTTESPHNGKFHCLRRRRRRYCMDQARMELSEESGSAVASLPNG